MIHIFCALSCEAEPITQYFKLGRLKEFNLFRLYLSEDKQISLTITGIGKLNAAAAVSYHHGCLNTSISDIWLNIGVAGHANLPVGEACLINKITDNQHKTSWYPQILFKTECTSASELPGRSTVLPTLTDLMSTVKNGPSFLWLLK